jgi:glycosyltransferase involved in cell wall biosynthesis
MDDCSPDHTAEVARSFGDPRVKHVRNDPNLGHLRNYNKGIELARGRYIWLISADDYLRRTYVLQRYMDVLEKHPNVGYAFCSGVGVRDGRQTEVLGYSVIADRDLVLEGHAWLKRLLMQNVVLAASGLVRRKCYEKLGAFPLDMPWAGDWFLWCLFALHHDAAYFAEPMVCYREHSLSMTTYLNHEQAQACCEEEIAIPRIIKRRADEAGFRDVSRECRRALAAAYARSTAAKRFGMARPVFTLDQLEASLARNTSSENERNWIRARVYAAMGSEFYWQGDMASAKRFYDEALAMSPWMVETVAKRILLSLGASGTFLRRVLRSRRAG